MASWDFTFYTSHITKIDEVAYKRLLARCSILAQQSLTFTHVCACRGPCRSVCLPSISFVGITGYQHTKPGSFLEAETHKRQQHTDMSSETLGSILGDVMYDWFPRLSHLPWYLCRSSPSDISDVGITSLDPSSLV
jgi:hypothetical protein